jgi:hypothetical protein
MGILAVLLLCQTLSGSEQENYLRYLQTLKRVPMYPWGVRPFSAQPAGWLPLGASLRYNSTFPYGYNDGAIWAGKGVTLAAEGGFAWRRGVLSLTIAPAAFVAQNASFPVTADSLTGIDRPQRFGNRTYARLDPGQSTLRVDWRALTLGASSANEYWGPALDFPMILGNNAAGFPHIFLGTAHPVALGPIRVHTRLLWGRLEQSAFSAETLAAGRRYATGIIVDLTTRWVPGLEIGATRFSHRPSFDGLAMFRGSEAGLRSANELASAFFRWVLPNSGFEFYGEYGRDDYSANLRDFVLEPDHDAGYTLGFRKAFADSADFIAIRVELQNTQLSSIAQGRPWTPFYTSSYLRQGHTQLGQVLGSEAAPGGGGSIVAVESYSPTGRWTWSWTRMIRQQRGDPSGNTPDPNGVDVQHALAVERVQRRGRTEIRASVAGVYELNRHFTYDAFDLNVVLGIRYDFSVR